MATPIAELGVATPRTQSSASLRNRDSKEKDSDWEETTERPVGSNYSNVFDDPLLAK